MGQDVQEYEERLFGANITSAKEPFRAGIALASDKPFGAGITVLSKLKPFSFTMCIGSQLQIPQLILLSTTNGVLEAIISFNIIPVCCI